MKTFGKEPKNKQKAKSSIKQRRKLTSCNNCLSIFSLLTRYQLMLIIKLSLILCSKLSTKVNSLPKPKQISLTLQVEASGIDIELRGAFKAPPCKNLFRDHFDLIFLHRKGWGIKITQENFFKMGFETKKYHFCVLFA